MFEKFILFGVGKVGRRLGRCLNDLEIEYHYYCDNNPLTWGKVINGKKVIKPKQLKGMNCKIVIAMIDSADVRRQLIDLVKEDNLISIDQMNLYICNTISEKDREKLMQYQVTSKHMVYVDNFFTELWGGMEQWAYVVASQLLKRKRPLIVLTNKEHSIFLKDVKNNLCITQCSREDWWKSISELLEEILSHMPCTIICNTIDMIYYVASCAKRLYPENIKIIMVRHNNRESLNNQLGDNIQNIDVVMGVGKDICKTLHSVNRIPKDKLVYKESFVDFTDGLIRTYSNGDMPLQICVVGRLEKLYKRMDLLIPIIQNLESKKCNYILNIAGTGSYEEILKAFVKSNDLRSKVNFNEFLDEKQLEVFFIKQDVYINCSDSEGSSLAMLEAMSWGVVPVVTNVGSVGELIEDGANGYICNVGDVESICNSIIKAENHKGQLPVFGKRCRELVKEKCNLNDYIDYIEDVINRDNLEKYQKWK